MKNIRLILIICIILNFTYAFGQADTYEIYALKFGERTNKIPVTEAAVGAIGNDSLNVCFMYWLLRGNNGKVILVDAGFTNDFEINPQFITWSAPEKMLDKLNIDPASVTDIILTHPHWDHIGGISLYRNAHVWMQKEDYNYFVSTAWQEGGNNGGFNKTDVLKIVQRNLDGKLTLINGDNKEIIPGIKVFIGSKHTFESQYVLVNTLTEKVIIASDNAWFYYNLKTLLSIPYTHDAKAYIKNLKRMKKMIKNVDLIIPGHDPLVFSKFTTVAPDVVKIR